MTGAEIMREWTAHLEREQAYLDQLPVGPAPTFLYASEMALVGHYFANPVLIKPIPEGA